MNPTHLGPYEIRSRLGRGGMGAVYEAVDPATGATVAVKVLASHLADDEGVRQRFESEIDALKNLRHPGIVRLLAFGEQDDQPYFAMELVRGQSLEQLLRAGRRFTWRETVAIATEITRALKAAHDHGIVHRDLKPANLLIADEAAGGGGFPADAAAGDAERVTVKLADFGIAKLFGGVAHTAHGHVVGTAEYMAPEQAAGRPLDHRADLYALGLVMYAMMTGGPPFRGTQLTEIIDKQRRAIPPRVASLVADTPPELDELIARLLSKEPAQRPASALALGRLLAAVETLHPAAPAAPSKSQSPSNSQAAGSQVAGRGDGNQGTGQGRSAAPSAGRAGSAIPTALDRSKRQTAPIDPTAATGPMPAAPGAASQAHSKHPILDLDLLAATQPPRQRPPGVQPPQGNQGPRPAASQPRQPRSSPPPTAGSTAITQEYTGKGAEGRTAGSIPAGGGSRLSTDAASAATLVDHGPRNRHTTVEELRRSTAEQARREQLRQTVWQGVSAILVAAALAAAGWFLLKPPTADRLYERISAVAADEHGDLRDVREQIDAFLARHGEDPRAERVRELDHTMRLDQLERRLRRRLRGDKDPAALERDYRAAMTNEENGPSACLKSLESLLAVHSDTTTEDDETRLLLDLIRRQVQRMRPRAGDEQREDARQIGELLAKAASLADRAQIANDDAARQRFVADRRLILENVVEVYGKRPHAAEAVAFARRELTSGTEPQPAEPAAPASPPAPPGNTAE